MSQCASHQAVSIHGSSLQLAWVPILTSFSNELWPGSISLRNSPLLYIAFVQNVFYHSKEWKQKCSKIEPHPHPYTLSHWRKKQERTVPHLTWHKPPVLGRVDQFLLPLWWHLEGNLWTPFPCSRNGINWLRSVAKEKLCFLPAGLTSESRFQIRNNPNSSITQHGYRKLRFKWIDLRRYIPTSLY